MSHHDEGSDLPSEICPNIVSSDGWVLSKPDDGCAESHIYSTVPDGARLYSLGPARQKVQREVLILTSLSWMTSLVGCHRVLLWTEFTHMVRGGGGGSGGGVDAILLWCLCSALIAVAAACERGNPDPTVRLEFQLHTTNNAHFIRAGTEVFLS